MNFAPIIIFCYNRPIHLKALIDSLLLNSLAKESHLFIFSDGFKGKSDFSDVMLVRDVIKNIEGFKKITIVERSYNFGLGNSVIDGVSRVFEEYDNVIVLEDDLLVSSDFLQFMNEGLLFYENESRIFCVSGFNFKFQLPKTYLDEVYVLPRICSYGWGTWKDRWSKVDWSMEYFPQFIEDKSQREMYEKGGEDLTLILLKQYLGYYESWAIRWDYNRFLSNAYCVYPVFPKVINRGADGSGTNDSIFIRNNRILSSNTVSFQSNVREVEDILFGARSFFKLSLIKKVYFKYLLFKYYFKKCRV